MTEDEMVGWHHRLDGHEFEHVPGVGDGQGSLACYSPWSHKELETAEQMNRSEYFLLLGCKNFLYILDFLYYFLNLFLIEGKWLSNIVLASRFNYLFRDMICKCNSMSCHLISQ